MRNETGRQERARFHHCWKISNSYNSQDFFRLKTLIFSELCGRLLFWRVGLAREKELSSFKQHAQEKWLWFPVTSPSSTRRMPLKIPKDLWRGWPLRQGSSRVEFLLDYAIDTTLFNGSDAGVFITRVCAKSRYLKLLWHEILKFEFRFGWVF